MKRVLFVTVLLLSLASIAMADQQFAVVSPQWVADHVRDPGVRILDVRADPHVYFAGHVPNAVNIADNTMRGPKDGVPVQYLPPDLQGQLLSRAGVRNDDTIVVYSDGTDVLGATMIAYVLEKIGHKDVKLMDGGWSAYKATQQSSQTYPLYSPARLSVRENSSIFVTLDQVRKAIGDRNIKFIDARPNQAYAGEISTWMRNGHIPGAINVDWHSLMAADNPHSLRPIDEMQKIYSDKGIAKTDNIILYCGTSREASLEYEVMKHLLGFSKVRLYEGSWTEYSAHSDLPIEKGNPR